MPYLLYRLIIKEISCPFQHLNVSKYKCLSSEDDGNVEMAQQMIEESKSSCLSILSNEFK